MPWHPCIFPCHVKFENKWSEFEFSEGEFVSNLNLVSSKNFALGLSYHKLRSFTFIRGIGNDEPNYFHRVAGRESPPWPCGVWDVVLCGIWDKQSYNLS